MSSAGNQPTPSPIWHYTSSHGLLGIVQQRALWASHIAFLNDTEEFRHVISVLEQSALERFGAAKLDSLPWARLRTELERRLLTFDDEFFNSDFVVSFSELKDSLSQW